jgi:predicted Zn-dependent protease
MGAAQHKLNHALNLAGISDQSATAECAKLLAAETSAIDWRRK